MFTYQQGSRQNPSVVDFCLYGRQHSSTTEVLKKSRSPSLNKHITTSTVFLIVYIIIIVAQ